MTYAHTQEAYRDALEMERHSLLCDEVEDDDCDESHLPPHKRREYAEMMCEAADMLRKERRENGE